MELDPLAAAYAIEYYWATDKLPSAGNARAEQFALRSLQIDESLPRAHRLAGIRFITTGIGLLPRKSLPDH